MASAQRKSTSHREPPRAQFGAFLNLTVSSIKPEPTYPPKPPTPAAPHARIDLNRDPIPPDNLPLPPPRQTLSLDALTSILPPSKAPGPRPDQPHTHPLVLYTPLALLLLATTPSVTPTRHLAALALFLLLDLLLPPQSDLSLHAVIPSHPKIPTIPYAHVTRPETPKTLSYPTRTNSKQNTAHTLPALALLKWESPSYPVP